MPQSGRSCSFSWGWHILARSGGEGRPLQRDKLVNGPELSGFADEIGKLLGDSETCVGLAIPPHQFGQVTIVRVGNRRDLRTDDASRRLPPFGGVCGHRAHAY